MNPFKAIFHAYLRWRHSKGYGVHSPFAYNLVKMAVYPGNAYGYYGYYDIDRAIISEKKKEYPRLRKDARLALRIIATLKSRRLLLYPQSYATFKAVADALGIPRPAFKEGKLPAPGKGDFLLIRHNLNPVKEITVRLNTGTAVMAIDPSPALRGELLQFNGKGLALIGKRIIVVIPNNDMAFVPYEMRL